MLGDWELERLTAMVERNFTEAKDFAEWYQGSQPGRARAQERLADAVRLKNAWREFLDSLTER